MPPPVWLLCVAEVAGIYLPQVCWYLREQQRPQQDWNKPMETAECAGLANGDGDPGLLRCPLYGTSNSTNSLSVVFSKHLRRWWCCNSNISSSLSSNSIPDSWAASLASAAFFLLTKAAPDDAFAIRILASRAFCKMKKISC